MPSQQYEPTRGDSNSPPGPDQPTQEQPSLRPDPPGTTQSWNQADDPPTQTYDPYPSEGEQRGPSSGDAESRTAQGYSPQGDDSDGRTTAGYDPTGYDTGGYDPERGTGAPVVPVDSDAVRAREKEAFGGVKVGAAFFGWLTAVGATVVLVAILAAIASALDLSTTFDGTATSQDPSSLGLDKIIAGLGILFVAYYVGGYVAGRMARFNGVRQGIAVWLWAVLIAAVLTLVGVLFDSNSNLARDVSLPDFRIDVNTVTTETLIAVGIVLAVTLIGAILGGLAGMRFHRRVDRAGFAPDPY